MTTTRELDDELRRRYESWSTEDLFRVIHTPGDYRPEAVQIARDVLAIRNVPLEGSAVEGLVAELQSERAAAQESAVEPLGNGLRAICFLFCGIPGIAIAAYEMSKGHTRRAHDAWTWLAYRWLTRVLVFLILYLL